MPLSAQQIDLLVSTGRISPESGDQLKASLGLQSLDRGMEASAPMQAPTGNMLGTGFTGLTATPVGQQAPMFPELSGQPSAAPPAPAPVPTQSSTASQPAPSSPPAPPTPAPPMGARGPILPDGALPPANLSGPSILPPGALPGVTNGQQADAKATLDLLGKAANYVSPVVPIGRAINRAFDSAAKTPGVAEALTTGNVTGAGQAALDQRAKNAAPQPDSAQPGESNAVEDKQPIADPAVQQAMQQQAQQHAYQAAVGAYNKALGSWRSQMESNFDGYVGKSANDRMAAYDARGRLLEQQGDENSKMQNMQGAVQFNQAMRDQQVEADQRDKLSTKLNEMERINTELMNSKVDDRRWWSSHSTPTKIFLALGKIISSAALKKNTLDPVIDQDIKLQMDQFNRKREGLSAQQNLFTRYMELFGDQKQAMAATRLAMKQYAASQIDAVAARHAGELGKNNAELAKGEIEGELEKERYKLWMMLHPAPQAPGMGAGAANTLGDNELKRMFQTPDGRTWFAPTGEAGEDFRGMFGGVGALSQALDTAEKVKQENPKSWFVPGTEANKTLKAIQYDMNAEAKRAAGKGENSDKDFAFRIASIGDLASPNLMPGGGSNIDQARQFVEGRKRVLVNQLNASGSVGVVTGYGLNPKTGKTERIYQYKGTQYYSPTQTGVPNNSGAPPVPGMKPNNK